MNKPLYIQNGHDGVKRMGTVGHKSHPALSGHVGLPIYQNGVQLAGSFGTMHDLGASHSIFKKAQQKWADVTPWQSGYERRQSKRAAEEAAVASMYATAPIPVSGGGGTGLVIGSIVFATLALGFIALRKGKK
jgi:hypothetical protein